jgi:hypothetical protein
MDSEKKLPKNRSPLLHYDVIVVMKGAPAHIIDAESVQEYYRPL